MFLTYLPTSLKVKRNELISIDPFLSDKVAFSVPYSKSSLPQQPNPDISLLTSPEIRPQLVIVGGFAVPMCTGVISIEDFRPGILNESTKQISIGYDAHKNTYQNLVNGFRPETFDKCHHWTRVLKFEDLLFNLLARATKINLDAKVNAPSRFKFNFQSKSGELEAERFDNPYLPKGYSAHEAIVALHKDKWVKVTGDLIVELGTNKVVTETFELNESVLYMVEPNYHYIEGNKFKFDKSHQSYPGFDYKVLNVNVPTSIHDHDIGKKLFDALGVDYDVYDEVKFDDGKIDPRSFADGKHNFAVVKSKVLILDTNEIESRAKKIAKETKNEDDKESEHSLFGSLRNGFSAHRLDNFNRSVSAMESCYLAINYNGDINDVFLKNLSSNWNLTNILHTLLDSKNIEEKINLLKELIISEEIYIPIFTPRLDEEVAAQLNATLQEKFDNNLNQITTIYNSNRNNEERYYPDGCFEF